MLKREEETKDRPQKATDERQKAKGKRQNVSHIGMIPMMVKAIQELSAKVKALEEA